jgi:hypothetical protein
MSPVNIVLMIGFDLAATEKATAIYVAVVPS